MATTTSGIILAALKVAEKVLDILNLAEELKRKKLKNTNLVKDMQNEAENEKKNGIEEIKNNIAEKLGIKHNGEGDKIKALDTAVKNLVNTTRFPDVGHSAGQVRRDVLNNPTSMNMSYVADEQCLQWRGIITPTAVSTDTQILLKFPCEIDIRRDITTILCKSRAG